MTSQSRLRNEPLYTPPAHVQHVTPQPLMPNYQPVDTPARRHPQHRCWHQAPQPSPANEPWKSMRTCTPVTHTQVTEVLLSLFAFFNAMPSNKAVTVRLRKRPHRGHLDSREKLVPILPNNITNWGTMERNSIDSLNQCRLNESDNQDSPSLQPTTAVCTPSISHLIAYGVRGRHAH
jgi:hypothetical protein